MARVALAMPIGWTRGFLIAALTLAGAIHLLLTPDHFTESAVLGVGFFGSAIAEFGLAFAVLMKPRRLAYVAVIGVSVALIGLYAYNVMIGLPFNGASIDGSHDNGAGHSDAHHSVAAEHDPDHEEAHSGGGHHSGGLMLGEGEAMDMLGATTKLSELATIGLAVALIRRSRVSTRTCIGPRVEGGPGDSGSQATDF